ncbi:MAG TPA: hydantoinase B/oxoprolinase family protein, partial [Mycobacteriales bacterium]|nr:hydantoinase B/oxoprolinase family protein [Mycobacteriales bacterium]
EPASLSLLTDRRRHAPAGTAGGGPGKPGLNLLGQERLPAKTTRELAAGDVVSVFTPGGGGYAAESDGTPESVDYR